MSVCPDTITISTSSCQSQQRGPASAMALMGRLQQLNLTEPRVLVMRGGWRMFSSRYAYTQPELIEGAD